MGFGRAIKSKGRPLSVMAQLKTCCGGEGSRKFPNAIIIIAIAKAENNPDYKAYREGRKMRPVVRKLLAKAGIHLLVGGGIPELMKFKNIFGSIR